MTPEFSIQISSYNRKEILKRALEEIFRQDFPPDKFEIILVDDGSTDGTGEMVKSLNPPCHLEYIYQPNSGLATARNTGIRNARGRYILFIDDDILADPSLLNEHLKFHEKFPESVVRGWVNHVDDLENIRKPRFTWADISTAFFWTSNVSVARDDLLRAGLFDESFKEYGWEDLEIGLRLKKLGLRSIFNKNAVVYHFKKKWNRNDMEKLCLQSEAKGRTAVIFLKKHPTWRVKLATGIHTLRFLLNDLLYMRGMGEKFFRKVLENSNDNTLEGFSRFAAQQLINFRYFDTIRKELKKT